MVPHFFAKTFTNVSGDVCRVLSGVSDSWLSETGHSYDLRCKYRSWGFMEYMRSGIVPSAMQSLYHPPT